MSTKNLTSTDPATQGVVTKLATLDRFLPVWIGLAMVVGLLGGRLIPGLGDAVDAVAVTASHCRSHWACW